MFLFLSFRYLLFKIRNDGILQLTSFVIVRIILCMGQVQFCLFELFLIVLYRIELLLFTLPFGNLFFIGFIEARKFFDNLIKACLALLVIIFFEGSLFELKRLVCN